MVKSTMPDIKPPVYLDNVRLLRSANDSVEISWKGFEDDRTLSIYKGESPEAIDYRTPVACVKGKSHVQIFGLNPDVRFYFELIGMMEERFLLLHRHYPYQLAERNPVCRGYLEDIYNCLVDIFEQAIIKGQEDGSIADVPARKSAFLILSMVDGLVRFKTNNLYNIGPLYEEVSKTCKRMLQSEQHERKTAADG